MLELLFRKSLICRVSSVVEQRFCKPLVGSSNLSPGTNGLGHPRDASLDRRVWHFDPMGSQSRERELISYWVDRPTSSAAGFPCRRRSNSNCLSTSKPQM